MAIDVSEPMLRRLEASEFGADSAPVVVTIVDAARLGLYVAPGWRWQEDPRWVWHAELVDSLGVSFAQTPSSGGDIARGSELADQFATSS